jgi:hypothetical protein
MKITIGKLTTLIMEETEKLLAEITDDDLDSLFALARKADPKPKLIQKKQEVDPLSYLDRDDLEAIINAFVEADPEFANLIDAPDEEFFQEGT